MARNPVAFLLPVYNEAETLTKSAYSILNQTIEEPMDIVFSDHCSTDGTFERLKGIKELYDVGGGKHNIIIMQCPKKNTMDTVAGVHEHINWLMQRLDNDFFIMGTGDDYEYPDRAKEVVKAWRETGAGFVTNTQEIVVDGELMGAYQTLRMREGQTRFVTPDELVSNIWENPSLNGSSAWSAKLWHRFKPLPDFYANDVVMPMWGALSFGTFNIGKVLKTFYFTGKQTGLGSQFMAEKDPVKKIKMQELMCFERVGISLYYNKLIEEEMNRAAIGTALELEALENNPCMPTRPDNRLAHLTGLYVKMHNTLLRRTSEWHSYRVAMTVNKIQPDMYKL